MGWGGGYMFPTRLLTSEDEYKWYWHQMIYFPETINTISTSNTISPTHSLVSSLAMHTTYSVHAGILKPWRGRHPRPLAVFSFYHVLSLPLSGLNWRSLFPPWGSSPPFPKMAPPFTGSVHTPLPGSGTVHVGRLISKKLFCITKITFLKRWWTSTVWDTTKADIAVAI
jgi:hypothetical protein